MKIYIAMPTGQRTGRVRVSAGKWAELGIPVISYTWDQESRTALEPICEKLYFGERQSYPKLINFLAAQIKDWDVLICGADDLWPDKGTGLIGLAAREAAGKIIWAADGYEASFVPTHAVITRQWYDKYNEIFDEQFHHNFCDVDLFARTLQKGEIVKCFDICFDHRHPRKTGGKTDVIYQSNESTYQVDKEYFLRKHQAQLEEIPPLDMIVWDRGKWTRKQDFTIKKLVGNANIASLFL